MESFLREFRQGLRGLAKSPGFAVVAALTLALGIGSSTAIFSVVDAVLLRSLPYPKPGRLVRVWEQSPNGRRMNFSDPDFDDFRAQNDTLSSLAAYTSSLTSVSGGSEPVRVDVAVVSADFFKTLGVGPVRGRAFAPEEQRLYGAPAAIVSYGYWQKSLGGAAELSGLRLVMEGTAYPIVGVMPADFDFPPGSSAWIARELGPELSSRTAHNWRSVGRLRDGVTVAQTRANLGAIARRLRDQYGKDVDLADAAVVPLSDAIVGDVKTALWTLFAAVALLLLVACANVAGLLLARTSARRKELAVRAALGAGRARLVRQFLAEALALALVGGGCGVLLAIWAVRLLPAVLPANLPRQQGVGVDAAVLLFALVATLGVAVALGIFSAWRASGANVQDALTSGSRGYIGGRGSQRLRGILVAGEMAATLVMLVGAGLLGRSFLRLVSTDPGFSPRNLVTMEFSPPPLPWQGDEAAVVRQIRLMDELVARLRALPGVESAGLAGAMPVAAGDDLADGTFILLGGQKAPADYDEFGKISQNPAQAGRALFCVAGEAYFRTMGIPLVRGRMFGDQDRRDTAQVVLISQSLAKQRWPGQDPVGEIIDFGNMDGDLRPMTIVGIVGDVRASGLDLPPSPVIYVNYRQRGMKPNSSPTVVLRTADPASELVPAAQRIFRDMFPDAPVKVSTFDDEMGSWLAARRFLLLLVGVFAAAALVLAAVGIYGIVAFSVTRRTQEIGIRMALGAERSDVLRLVVGEGARLAGIGVVIGIAGALAVTRLVEGLLFGVSATDPLTFAAVAALLVVAALLASYVPARRAMALDPNAALRYE